MTYSGPQKPRSIQAGRAYFTHAEPSADQESNYITGGQMIYLLTIDKAVGRSGLPAAYVAHDPKRSHQNAPRQDTG